MLCVIVTAVLAVRTVMGKTGPMTESVPALQLGGDLNAQIATFLRFSVCTASGDAGPSDPFGEFDGGFEADGGGESAEWLEDTPELPLHRAEAHSARGRIADAAKANGWSDEVPGALDFRMYVRSDKAITLYFTMAGRVRKATRKHLAAGQADDRLTPHDHEKAATVIGWLNEPDPASAPDV